MTKAVVALLTEAETVAACLAHAAALTCRLPAQLVAQPVGVDPRAAVLAAEEVDLHWLRQRREGDFSARRERIRAAYDAWAAPAAPPVIWCDDADAFAASGPVATADVVVLARSARLDGRDALHTALFQARRLVLVAPPSAPVTLGRHVAIGWKTGAPVERALAAGRDWLRAAEQVTVLCVTRPETTAYVAAAEAALRRLDVPATVVSVARQGPSVGRQLLAEAAARGADCLLIGAYRHGEVWEALLGGVTRDVLTAATLPVFLKA